MPSPYLEPARATSVPRLLPLWAVLFAFQIGASMGCSGGPAKPAQTTPRISQGVLLSCTPETAEIYVNDKYMGTVSGLGKKPLPLAAGPHRIELRHGGYFSHFVEIDVAKGVRQKLTIDLRKEPF